MNDAVKESLHGKENIVLYLLMNLDIHIVFFYSKIELYYSSFVKASPKFNVHLDVRISIFFITYGNLNNARSIPICFSYSSK